MGGHGGLNILPQKRWNVYRFDNMEKVRKDEEAAAKEEQIKREQGKKRDAEFRMEKLRTAKGLEPLVKEKVEESGSISESGSAPVVTAECVVTIEETKVDSKHINLFEGIKIFDVVEKVKKVEREDERPKKKRKEESVRVVTTEDEKYRLGYGIVGKGVKLPWYMSKPNDSKLERDVNHDNKSSKRKDKSKNSGKKSLEELREERLTREKREKAREKALLASGRDRPVPEDKYYRR